MSLPPHTLSRTTALLSLGALLTGCVGASVRVPLAGPDRPGYSFGTATVPGGGVQAELGYTDTQAGSQSYHSVGEGLFRVGVGRATELRVSTNSFGVRTDAGASQHGFEDLKLGVKQKLLAGHGTTGLRAASVALIAGTTLPTGSDGFGAGVAQPEAILAAAIPVTTKLSLVPNLGDTYTVLDGRRAHRVTGTVAGWYAFSGTVSAFGEYAGSQAAGRAETRLHYFDAGVAVVPAPAIQLDLRVGHGANGLPRDRYVGVGVTRRF
jgi:hypothetical protein